jgi:hypothetical protein
MSTRTTDEASSHQFAVENEDFELGSFTQNVALLESVVTRMEKEVSSEDPNPDRLNIFQTEAQSLLYELQPQQARAVELRGVEDENVRRLQNVLLKRFGGVIQKSEEILRGWQARLIALDVKRTELDSTIRLENPSIYAPEQEAAAVLRAEESVREYSLEADSPGEVVSSHKIESLADAAPTLTSATVLLNQISNAHPDLRDELLPVLKKLLDLTMTAVMSNGPADGIPPRGPVDTPRKGGDDGEMEARITNLEKFADEARKDLRSVDVRLGKLETIADSIHKNMATKSDIAEIKTSISQAESTLLKWAIGTALTTVGVAVGVGGLVVAAFKLFT